MNDSIDILLVEDTHADVELIRVMLDSASLQLGGFRMIAAQTLAQAKVFLAERPFDVVLLDLGLPDSHGLETLQCFIHGQAGPPVIVLTGLTDEQMGVEAVNSGAQDFLPKDTLDARSLRRSIRYCMERHRLENEQRRLSAQLLNAISDEQQRIARELHDEVGQGLAGLNMMSRSLAMKLRVQDPNGSEKLRRISDGIQNVLDSFRKVLCGLSPVDIDEQGLPVALRRLCETIQQTGVACKFECEEGFSMQDNAIATHLYRIAQESLTNAMRHAGAQQLCVTLSQKNEDVKLSVSDNGVGFDLDAIECRGMGLRILRHRCNLIGGALTLKSNTCGTHVTCEVNPNGP